MKALIQRVSSASVVVDGTTVGEVGNGLLVLLGVEASDTEQQAQSLASRVVHYRVFADERSPMNINLLQAGGELLVVSQFTLAARTDKGLRASLASAAKPDVARYLYQRFVVACRSLGVVVATGQFGAMMQVQLTNDGPVTFLLSA